MNSSLRTALCVLALSLSPTSARADSREARVLYEEGSRYFDLGDYDRAIERFERAYTLSGAPGLLFDLAQAHRLKGPEHCEKARSFYERYLQKTPGSSRRAEVERRITEMKACAGNTAPATAPATVPPPPASPGSAPPATASSGAAPPATAPPAAASATTAPPRPAPAARASGWKIVGFGGVGLAVIGAGAAAVAGGMALGRQSSLTRACDPDGTCPDSESAHIRQYETLQIATWVGAIGAGVGLGVAVFSFWRASVQPTISAEAIGLRGRF